MKSFIVGLWRMIFKFLRWVSVFHIIRKIYPEKTKSHCFVDFWVLLNLLLSILSILIVKYDIQSWVIWTLIIWGAIRTFEIVVYQVNVLFFDPCEVGFQDYSLGGYRRIIILALHNYLELIFWFASFYFQSRLLFNDQAGVLSSCLGTIYYSVVTITTLGHGDVTPCSNLTMFLVISQSLMGVFFIAIIVARFISYLPKPKTLDKKENTRAAKRRLRNW
ncbi:MAG: potassium channel family protein [Smithellaceae bacterium]|jgi:hypothetical protein